MKNKNGLKEIVQTVLSNEGKVDFRLGYPRVQDKGFIGGSHFS
ncbi:MAG: hypothetical protein V5A87_06060 [Candidatus Bipolaricaulota bacterium]